MPIFGGASGWSGFSPYNWLKNYFAGSGGGPQPTYTATPRPPRLEPQFLPDPDEVAQQRRRALQIASEEDEYDLILKGVEEYAAANPPGAPMGQWSASPWEHLTGAVSSLPAIGKMGYEGLKRAAFYAPLVPGAQRFAEEVAGPEAPEFPLSVPTPWGTAAMPGKAITKTTLPFAASQVNPMNVAFGLQGLATRAGMGLVVNPAMRALNLLLAGAGAEEMGRAIANEEDLDPVARGLRAAGGATGVVLGGYFGARPTPGPTPAFDALQGIAARSEAMAPNVIPPKPPGWVPGQRPPGALPPAGPGPIPPPPAAAGPRPMPGVPPPAAGPKLPSTFDELAAAMNDALRRGDTAELARLDAMAQRAQQGRGPLIEDLEIGPLLSPDVLPQELGPVTPTRPSYVVGPKPRGDGSIQPGLEFQDRPRSAYEQLQAGAPPPPEPPPTAGVISVPPAVRPVTPPSAPAVPVPPPVAQASPYAAPETLDILLGPTPQRPAQPVRTAPALPLGEGIGLEPPQAGPPARVPTYTRPVPVSPEPSPRAPAPPAERLPEGVTSGAVLTTTDPTILKLDPTTYQFKESDVRGIVPKGGALAGATEWTSTSPPLLVHERLDGSLYIADGYQRYAGYLRMKAEGKTVPPLKFEVYRESEGITAADMRRVAALHNIGAGTGTELDIAKLLRGGPLTPRERAQLVKGADSEKAAGWIKGERISKMEDPAYQMVVQKEVDPSLASYVTNHFADPAEQVAALRLLKRSRIKTESEADSFFAAVKEHGFGEAAPDAQGQLPGFEKTAERIPIFESSAKLQRDALKELGAQRAAFGGVVRHAQRLEAAGNVLDPDINLAAMTEATTARLVFEKYARLSGTETRKAINDLAPKLVAGDLTSPAAVEEVLAALQRDIEGITQPPTGGVPEVQRGPSPPHPEPPPAVRPEPVRPVEEIRPVEPEAPPEEVQKILDDLAKTTAEQPLVVDELPPLSLTAEKPTARVSRRELEVEHGQRSILEQAEPPPVRPQTIEEVFQVNPPPTGRGPEQVPVPVEAAPPPAAPVVRRPPAEQAPVTPPGGVPWEEHPNGWAVGPEGRDFIAIKLPRMGAEGKAIPEVREAIRDLGGRYRKNFEQWFIDVNDATREPTLARVRQILNREVGPPAPPVEAAVAAPPAPRPPQSIEEMVTPAPRAEPPPAPRPVAEAAPPPAPTERPAAPEAAAPEVTAPATWEQLKPNQRSYLTQQAKLSRDQIDGMTYDEVVEYGRQHGNEVRRARDEAAQAAREAAEKPPAEIPAAPTPVQRGPLPIEAREYLKFLEENLPPGEAPVDAALVMAHMEKFPNFFRGRMEAIQKGAERRAALSAIGRQTTQQMREEGLVPSEATVINAPPAKGWHTPVGEEISPKGKPRSEYTLEEPPVTEAQKREFVELGKVVDQWEVQAREGTPRPPQRVQHAQAAKRAQLIERGDPPALEEHAALLRELQDREYAIQVRNDYSAAKAAPPPKGYQGEFIGADMFGFVNLANLYRANPERFWNLARVAGIPTGAVTGATADPEYPVRGAILGAVLGGIATNRKTYQQATWQQFAKRTRAIARLRSEPLPPGTMHEVRAPRDLTRDISVPEWWLPFSPERIVPDVFKKVQPIFDELNRLVENTTFPIALRKAAVRGAHRQAAEELRGYAKVAADTGLKRRAAYLGELADTVAGKPTPMGLAVKKLLTELGVKDADTKWIERHVGKHVYRTLTGYGMDSAAMNLTQPILALRHIGPLDLIWGYRMRRTEWGKNATRHIRIHRPIDVIEDLATGAATKPVEELGGIKGFLKDPQRPLWVTDQLNRQAVYLGALRRASRKGLGPAAADEWARAVMRTSQGHYGPMSFNPAWRGPVGGSIRPFMKFPGMLIENLVDTISQPDVAGRGRLLLALAGASLAGKALGFDFEDVLLVGGRPLGLDISHPEETIQQTATGQAFPVGRAAADLAAHAKLTPTTPTHNLVIPRIVEREGLGAALKQPVELLEDILNTDLAYVTLGRYPTKVGAAAIRFGREGFGPHQVPVSSGAPSVVTPGEELANLLGVKSTRQTELRDLYQDMGRELRQTARTRTETIAFLRRDLSAALGRRDVESIDRILEQLTEVGQSVQTPRNALKAATLQRFERMMKTTDPRTRAKMEALLGTQARELQNPMRQPEGPQ